jgi:hypothetical protein
MSGTRGLGIAATLGATRIARDERFVSLYANQIRLGTSINDFTLLFGVTEDHGGQQVLVDKAAISMSPISFKALVAHVNMVLSAYEETIGPIFEATFSKDSIEKHKDLLRASLIAQGGLGPKAG